MTYEVLNWVVRGVPILALLAASLTILGRTPPPRLTRWLAWSIVPVLLLKTCVFSDIYYLGDFRVFHYAGRDMLAGHDPYLSRSGPDRLPYLNPPTFQPIAIAMGLLPLRLGGALWIGLSLLGTLGLVELSRRVLNRQGGMAGRPIPPQGTASLLAAVALSTASRMGLEFGQLHVMLALLVIGALGAQAAGRPVLAGLLLAPATSKPQTTLPFLILFLRRSDLATWVTMAVAALLMIVTTTPPHDLVARFASWQANVRASFEPGRINDLFSNNFALISPSEILLGLGVGDRDQIKAFQALVVVALGLALVYEIYRRGRWTRSAASALVACFSMLFLYHRTYDTVLLALPLVYATGAASRSKGPARALFAASAIAILVVMNTYTFIQATLPEKAAQWGPAGRLIRALAVPYPTYAVLLTLGTLWYAIRLQERGGIEDQHEGRTPGTTAPPACTPLESSRS